MGNFWIDIKYNAKQDGALLLALILRCLSAVPLIISWNATVLAILADVLAEWGERGYGWLKYRAERIPQYVEQLEVERWKRKRIYHRDRAYDLRKKHRAEVQQVRAANVYLFDTPTPEIDNARGGDAKQSANTIEQADGMVRPESSPVPPGEKPIPLTGPSDRIAVASGDEYFIGPANWIPPTVTPLKQPPAQQ